MTRTEMREHIFKILFRVEFHEVNELENQIELYFKELDSFEESDYDYIKAKALNIIELIPGIDDKINEISDTWPTTRLGKAELSIMRLAVYEILEDDDIPNSVAINEAVELAKLYGADNASSFVNGVLAKLL